MPLRGTDIIEAAEVRVRVKPIGVQHPEAVHIEVVRAIELHLIAQRAIEVPAATNLLETLHQEVAVTVVQVAVSLEVVVTEAPQVEVLEAVDIEVHQAEALLEAQVVSADLVQVAHRADVLQ